MKKIFFLSVLIFAANITQAQWEPDKRLTNDPAKSYTSGASQRNIASEGDFVHVVWQEARDGNFEIYYKRSTDAGVSWGTDTRLTNQFSSSDYPSITVSGLVVHIVWEDERDGNFEIYYKHSTDGGVSWGTDTRLTNATDESYQPCVGVSDSVVSVVWYDYRDGNPEIYYKRSTDGGLNWGADMRLTIDTSDSYFPSVAVSGSTVNVVWSDYRDVNEEIYYKRSSDDGATWGAETRLTNSAGYSDYPCVAASGSLVHVVWYDNREGAVSKIFYKRSADGGLSWGADIKLSDNVSYYASVAASGSFVHVVWDDFSDIYFKRSTDGGLTWEGETQLTNSLSSNIATVSVSDSIVHVVWTDYRDGSNGEIYYKRNATGNIIGIEDLVIAKNNLSVYPNPFSAYTNIEFEMASSGNAEIKIFNQVGMQIQTLKYNNCKAGKNTLQWNCSDKNGIAVPSGIYYFEVIFGKEMLVKKMIVLK